MFCEPIRTLMSLSQGVFEGELPLFLHEYANEIYDRTV